MRMTVRDTRSKTIHLLPATDSPTVFCGLNLYKKGWSYDIKKVDCARCLKAKAREKPMVCAPDNRHKKR